MKRLFMVLFGLASLHAAATAAKTAGEEKTPGKNAGAAASLWPEKMDPSFQGSRPECFKIWVIRNLRFPADRYDVGDEAKVEVVFAIDKNGTLTSSRYWLITSRLSAPESFNIYSILLCGYSGSNGT